MKISKILAGMSAAAIVASMAMIPASAAGTKLNVSDDLLKIARQTQDDLFAVYFNGKDEDMPNKDAIADLGTVYGASQSRLTTTIGTRSAVADQSTSTQSLVAGTLRTGLAALGLRTISQRILSATQQTRKAHTFLSTSATLLFSQQQTVMLIITQQLVSTTGQQTLRASTL